MSDCIGGTIVPDFAAATSTTRETDFGTVSADADPVSCLSTLQPPKSTECADFTKWSQWTGAACYFLSTAALIVESEVKNTKIMEEVYHSIGIVYTSIQGVNQAFNEAIVDVNQGKPFTPIINPVDPPPFPPINKGSNIAEIIQNAWNAIQPFLEQAITKLQNKDPNSIWIKVLQGLIDNSKNTIQQIVDLLDSIKGN